MTILTLLILLFIFFPALLWATYEKAGYKGYYAVIPLINYYYWLKVINKPLWWYIFLLLPFINVFMVMLMVVELLKSYNMHGLHQQAAAVILPFVVLPMLGSKDKVYTHPSKLPEIKKTVVREWVDAILFAVIAATIIRMFWFEAYTIPTSSMEKSLLVGDFLFVSKIAYGPKVPNTPIAFPFVHHTMPLSQTRKSYLEWIKLPFYRFPGFTDVKRGDAVVFNYPDGDTVALKMQNMSYYALVRDYGRQRVHNDNFNFGEIVARPVDKRENYIKRCIALPGDTLEIRNQVVYINNIKQEPPAGVQSKYYVRTAGARLSNRLLSRLDVTEEVMMSGPGDYYLTLTEAAAAGLAETPEVLEVRKIIHPEENRQEFIFPFDERYPWNLDNYGPMYVPKAGDRIRITVDNLGLYERIIKAYELNDLEVRNNRIVINGEETEYYTFKLDYYWLMGDNRHNSADSRFWGFVPNDHIVGKAVFVWLSLDPNKSLFSGKIRWNKVFRTVK